MREIRFRAWIANRKIMGDVTQIKFSRPDNPQVTLVGKYGEGNWKCGATLLQFTGLFDKNDKEIYEGDIVAWGWQKKGKGEVVYEHDQFVVRYNNGFMYFQHPEAYEIIGNIYENPELLTKHEKPTKQG